MADKDFRIDIKTTGDTRGAEQAEKALKDVETAADAAADAAREIANRQRALEVIRLGEAVQLAGDRFAQMADNMEAAGMEGSAAMRNTAQAMQQTGGAVSALAQGFAAGGPLGAGIALVTYSAKEMAQVVVEGSARAARSQRLLADAAAETARALAEQQRAAETLRLAEASALRQREAAARLAHIEKITGEMRDQVELAQRLRSIQQGAQKAEDEAALAEIDAAEATGAMSPEEAAAARIEVNEAAAQRAADEEIARARDQVESARAEIARGKDAKRAAEDDFTTAEERSDAAKPRVAAARAEAEQRRKNADMISRLAADGDPFFVDLAATSQRRAEEADKALQEELTRMETLDGETQAARESYLAAVKSLEELNNMAEQAQATLTATLNAEDRKQAARSRRATAAQTAETAGQTEETSDIDVSATAGALRQAAGNIAPSGAGARAAREELFGLARQLDADSQLAAGEVSQLIALIGEINARLGREGDARRRLQAQISSLEGQIKNNRD